MTAEVRLPTEKKKDNGGGLQERVGVSLYSYLKGSKGMLLRREGEGKAAEVTTGLARKPFFLEGGEGGGDFRNMGKKEGL